MSLVDNVSGEQSKQLAVLYCDISRTDSTGSAESGIALWRVNYFRAAREMAADYDGRETTAGSSGWVVTFNSTVDALMCARSLSSLVGWRDRGPSLSGGLSAGDVTQDARGISGNAVRQAIALCHQALPWQVLVADPLRVVVARETARSFAPAPLRTIGVTDSSPVLRLLTNRVPGDELADLRPRSEPHPTAPAMRTTPPPPAGPAPSVTGTTPATGTPATGTHPAGTHPAGTHPTAGTHPATGTHVAAGAHVAPSSNPGGTGIRLNVLGWVQIETPEPSGRWPVLRGSQARAVMSMLALRRGPVHREELAELLWPGSLPAHWEGALRGLISKIRRFLDAGGLASKDVLVGEGGYYELRLPPTATVDRDLAASLMAAAETALATNRATRAVVLVRQAAAILERRLLSGPDNAWFDQVRAELAHDRLAALELWARADLAAGGTDGAKRAATEALTLDPYRESSYRLLMQAHSAAGSRGEALRTYERCRRMLAEELGVGPATQTQALYIHLLG